MRDIARTQERGLRGAVHRAGDTRLLVNISVLLESLDTGVASETDKTTELVLGTSSRSSREEK